MENTKENEIKLAECLLEYSDKLDDGNQKRFIKTLARETIAKGKNNKTIEVSSKDIALEMFGNKVSDKVSEKLSPIWKKVEELKEQVREPLQAFAFNECGLDHYPWIEKHGSSGGYGKTSKYKVIAVPIDKKSIAVPNHYVDKMESDVVYSVVKDFKPSFLTKLIYGKNSQLSSSNFKKMHGLKIVIFLVFMFCAYVSVIFNVQKPLSEIPYQAIIWPLLIWLIYRSFDKSITLFSEDKIVIANDWWVGWREFGVTKEKVNIYNEQGDVTDSAVKLTKYVGKCSICGANVILDNGEPDFPRRIVGRCSESPREHVFSFDRVTRLGWKLHCNLYNISIK